MCVNIKHDVGDIILSCVLTITYIVFYIIGPVVESVVKNIHLVGTSLRVQLVQGYVSGLRSAAAARKPDK